MKPLLQFHLLGPAQILWNAQPWRIARRKARALLYYLALESQPGPVPREKLIELLWGDDNADGAKSLREALSRLRRALPDPSLLYYDREIVILDPARVWVDAREFLDTALKLQAQAQRAPQDALLPDELALEWQRILSFWKGDEPFQGVDPGPGGDRYERWKAYWSDLLLHLRRQGYRVLVEAAWQAGDYEQAGHLAMEAYKLDTSNGEMLLRAIRAFRLADMLPRAYQALQTAKAYLTENGLSQDILEEALRLLEKPKEPILSLPIVQVRPSLRLPFIGRQKIMERVVHAIQQGRSIVVMGEPGQGKSTLLERLAYRYLEKRVILVLTCLSGEEHLILQPWIEALNKQIPAEFWQNFHEPQVLAPLLTLMPHLKQYYPDLRPPEFASPEEREKGINQALLAILQKLSTSKPLLLLVDDLHWADRATRQALQFVLTRYPLRTPQGAAVITVRSGELSSELQDMLQRLRANAGVAVETLSPLGREALSQLAEQALQRPLHQEEVEQLIRFSGGNPFFALEMLRHWQRLAGQGRTLAEIDLPESITALVEQRLATLSPARRLVVEVAALAGSTFSARLLQQALDLPANHLSRLLEGLLNAGIVVATQENGVYRFVHEVIRKTIVDHLSPTRAWALHRQLAEALEALWGERAEARAAILAQHYHRAGEVLKAFHWWLRAARYAIRIGDRQASYHAFSQAEDLLLRHPKHFHEEEIWTLYNEWGDLAREVEDVQTLERVGRALMELARERQSLWLQGVGYDTLSEASIIRSTYPTGQRYAHKAVSLLRSSNRTFDLVEALVHKGVHEYMQGELAQAIRTLREAQTLGQAKEGDPLIARALGDTLYELGFCLTLAGDLQEARACAQQALTLYEQVHRPYGQAGALALLAFARYYLGEYALGAEEALQAAEWLRGLQKWRLLGSAYLYRAMNLLDMGHLGPTWEACEEALRVGREHHHPEIEATALRIQGDIFLALGAFAQAKTYYHQAEATDQSSFVRFHLLHRLGLIQALEKDPPQATRLLHIGLAIGLAQQAYLLVVPIREALAVLSMYTRQWDAAEEQARQALQEAQTKDMPIYLSWAHTLLGYLRLLQQKIEKAKTHFHTAIARFERIPLIWGTLYALYGLRILGDWGESEARVLNRLRATLIQHLEPKSEEKPPYLEAAHRFFQRMDQGDFGPIPGWTPEDVQRYQPWPSGRP